MKYNIINTKKLNDVDTIFIMWINVKKREFIALRTLRIFLSFTENIVILSKIIVF